MPWYYVMKHQTKYWAGYAFWTKQTCCDMTNYGWIDKQVISSITNSFLQYSNIFKFWNCKNSINKYNSYIYVYKKSSSIWLNHPHSWCWVWKVLSGAHRKSLNLLDPWPSNSSWLGIHHQDSSPAVEGEWERASTAGMEVEMK